MKQTTACVFKLLFSSPSKLYLVFNSNPEQQLLNFYKLPDGSETIRTTTPTPKLKETNVKPRQSYNQPPSVSQQMIEEAAITAACKVVEAENNMNVAKVAVEELEKTTKLADETELVLELAKEMHEQCNKKRDLPPFFSFFPLHEKRSKAKKKVICCCFCRLSWRGCGFGLSLWGDIFFFFLSQRGTYILELI